MPSSNTRRQYFPHKVCISVGLQTVFGTTFTYFRYFLLLLGLTVTTSVAFHTLPATFFKKAPSGKEFVLLHYCDEEHSGTSQSSGQLIQPSRCCNGRVRREKIEENGSWQRWEYEWEEAIICSVTSYVMMHNEGITINLQINIARNEPLDPWTFVIQL